MKLALRSLLKSPGYTIIALLTLALGIGVNTSMVSVVQTLLFRSGPFPQPEQIVQIMGATPKGVINEYSEPEVREILAQTDTFAALSIIGFSYYAIAEPGRPAERIAGANANADFFPTFGVQPMLGRAFTAEECQPGRNKVVVLSHTCWQVRYGGSRDVLGKTIRLDGETVEIIGVMPESFDYRMLWGPTQFWRPLAYTKDQLQWRDYRAFRLIGRMKPAAKPDAIASALATLAAVQVKQYPETYTGFRYRVLPLHEALMDDLGRQLSWMLLGLSGFVLLIACTNLANLQLARATAGMRDFAIRAALGASRRQLIFQQLTECVLLSLAGGALGLLLAATLNQVLEREVSLGGASGLTITIDTPVLVITLLVSLLTGVVFGLVPALLASRADVNTALKGQSRGSTAGRGHHRLRQILIVIEVAIALVLLGGAGILQRGFDRLLNRPAGWDTTRILTASLPIPETRLDTDAKKVEFFRKLEARLTALPGIEKAAIATSLPIFGYNGERQILTDGQSPGSAAQLPGAFHVMVTPDYFATIGIELVEGRLFAPDITAKSPPVIVVNESLARQLWPGKSAIGQRLGSMDSGKAYWSEVIGVVRDIESAANLAPPTTRLTVYKALVHEPWSWVYLVIRSPNPGALADTLRRAVEEVDPDMPADQITTIRQNVERSYHNLLLVSQMLTGFAALGLILAAVGIYGVISNLVAQRTSEFGIRLALGAQTRDVLNLVLSHGLRLTAIGLAVGLAGAYALGRVLNSMMPRLADPDVLTLLAVAAILFAVALFACWLPARRATKVDPLEALRAE